MGLVPQIKGYRKVGCRTSERIPIVTDLITKGMVLLVCSFAVAQVDDSANQDLALLVSGTMTSLNQGGPGFSEDAIFRYGASLVPYLTDEYYQQGTKGQSEAKRVLRQLCAGSTSDEIASMVRATVEARRAKGGGYFPPLEEILNGDYASFLEPYLEDDDSAVAIDAAHRISQIARRSQDRVLRSQVVEAFLKAGECPAHKSQLFELMELMRANACDFSENAKRIISKKLTDTGSRSGTDSECLRGLVLTLGIADMKSELPFLGRTIDDAEKNERLIPDDSGKSVAWAALMAGARMGVDEYAKRCVDLAQEITDTTKRMDVLGQLVYIRHPYLVRCLRTYLEKPAEDCRTSPDNIRSSPAQSAAYILLRSLDGVPVKVSSTLTVPEMIRLREWIDRQKGYQFKQ